MTALAQLVTWFEASRWRIQEHYYLTMTEGCVLETRRTRDGVTYSDGVHMAGSLHYSGLAVDLNLLLAAPLSPTAVYIEGDSPVWHALAARWLDLSPYARWGGDFGKGDYNHFEFRHP
jgi:hypothetical protein